VSAALTPGRLRCEDQDEPIAVDGAKPRLSWVLSAAGRGQRQTAYQVLVADDLRALAKDRGTLWDSGRVASAAQNQIEYGGRALGSNEDCFWKVRAWDQDGRAGPWSKPSRWRTALLHPGDWRASWIGAPAAAGLPLFRTEFDIAKPVRRAVVHLSGLGQCELSLDGRKVGDRFLDPAWSVYEKTVYYSTFDLTAALKPGRHAFGVMLGKGFYNTQGDRRVHGVNANRPLQFLLQAQITYADGTQASVLSDDSWRTTPGPVTHSAILGGEDFDARRLPRSWDCAGFDAGGWAGVIPGAFKAGVLRASLSPPMARHASFRPAAVEEPEPGVFVYDFGQNASAIPQLRVRGQAGQVVRLTPAEQRHGMQPRRNDGQGRVNPAGVGHPNYFQYTLRGGGSESWSPQFTYSGFQYLQVEGAVPAGRPNPAGLPVVEELISIHVRNTARSVGSFECSEDLFNRTDRIIDWAVRANLSHVLTDCPHREKLGWLEVSYLMGPSIAGRYDIARFYRKVARDCADSQREDGLVPTVAPAYPAFGGGFAYTPEWGAAAVVVPWQVFQWTGDRSVLAENFEPMSRFVDYMHRTSANLVPKPGLGDWYDYGHGKPVGESQFTPTELSAMATFYRCAVIVVQAARQLGRSADQEHYGALAEDIGRRFHAQWFDGVAQYRNSGSPQCANSMALATGLVPPAHAAAVLQAVVEDVQRRGNQQTAGDIGHWYLLQALAGAGRHDVIHAMTLRTNLGSYGFIVNNGWTSMPEAWDANTGASMNHCMLGHIQEWFLGHVAGIQPDPAAPGYERFLVAPQPVGAVAWARGEHDSIRGPIRSSWRREGDRFRLRVAVPMNSVAKIRIPADGDSELREGGRAGQSGRGWRVLGLEPGGILVEAHGGDYQFESRLRRGVGRHGSEASSREAIRVGLNNPVASRPGFQ
jgi:hypothetical protein